MGAEILDTYRDQIPTWAGFDEFSQLGPDYSEFDLGAEEGLMPPETAASTPPYPGSHGNQPTEPASPAGSPPTPDMGLPQQREQFHQQSQNAALPHKPGEWDMQAADDRHAQVSGYAISQPSHKANESTMTVGTSPATSSP